MAQSGYTPILIYASGTTTNVPLAANLTSSASGAELALNYVDGKLFYKDNAGVVQTLATKSSTSGVFTSVTDSGLTSGRVTYATTGGLLTDSANLTFNGTTLTANTIGAFTLGGTVAGGGNQLNNVIIGTTTPLAGSFTTLSASGDISLTSSTAQILGTGYISLVSGAGNNLYLNAPTGQHVYQRINNSIVTDVTSTGLAVTGTLSNTTGANFATSSGSVGIGTTSPNYQLHVTTSMAVGASGFNQQLSFTNDTIQSLLLGTGYTSLKLNPLGGNVGIGTSSPAALLDLGGNTASTVQQIFGRGVTDSSFTVRYTNGASGSAAFTGTLGLDYANGTWADMAAIKFYRNSTSGELAFFASASGASGTERMRLTSTGLGIGTSSPSTKLQVSGTNTNDNAGYWVAQLYNSASPVSGVGTGLSFATLVGTFGATLATIEGIKENGTTDNYASALKFTTRANGGNITEQMRLNSSGNLGLGVTPNAWPTGSNTIQASSSSLFGNSATLILASNLYYDSAYTPKYIGTNVAGCMQYNNGGVGGWFWFNAPSGTAGTTATLTQAMTLDNSGNLLVGTTSQLQSSRLSVLGSGNVGDFRTSSASGYPVVCENTATGSTSMIAFLSGPSTTTVGSITYNSGTGLTIYATTSDYRAKNITGAVNNSGALIDSTPVYMGKMKGATQERPMFIAHETPEYAHTGEKDAVDADGNPVYQQMDASTLIPVMWAELQSLRARVAQLETKGV